MSVGVKATAQWSFSVLLDSGVTTSETDSSLIYHQVCIFQIRGNRESYVRSLDRHLVWIMKHIYSVCINEIIQASLGTQPTYSDSSKNNTHILYWIQVWDKKTLFSLSLCKLSSYLLFIIQSKLYSHLSMKVWETTVVSSTFRALL